MACWRWLTGQNRSNHSELAVGSDVSGWYESACRAEPIKPLRIGGRIGCFGTACGSLPGRTDQTIQNWRSDRTFRDGMSQSAGQNRSNQSELAVGSDVSGWRAAACRGEPIKPLRIGGRIGRFGMACGSLPGKNRSNSSETSVGSEFSLSTRIGQWHHIAKHQIKRACLEEKIRILLQIGPSTKKSGGSFL